MEKYYIEYWFRMQIERKSKEEAEESLKFYAKQEDTKDARIVHLIEPSQE